MEASTKLGIIIAFIIFCCFIFPGVACTLIDIGVRMGLLGDVWLQSPRTWEIEEIENYYGFALPDDANILENASQVKPYDDFWRVDVTFTTAPQYALDFASSICDPLYRPYNPFEIVSSLVQLTDPRFPNTSVSGATDYWYSPYATKTDFGSICDPTTTLPGDYYRQVYVDMQNPDLATLRFRIGFVSFPLGPRLIIKEKLSEAELTALFKQGE